MIGTFAALAWSIASIVCWHDTVVGGNNKNYDIGTFAPLALIIVNASWPGVSRKVISLSLILLYMRQYAALYSCLCLVTFVCLIDQAGWFSMVTCPIMVTIGGGGKGRFFNRCFFKHSFFTLDILSVQVLIQRFLLQSGCICVQRLINGCHITKLMIFWWPHLLSVNESANSFTVEPSWNLRTRFLGWVVRGGGVDSIFCANGLLSCFWNGTWSPELFFVTSTRLIESNALCIPVGLEFRYLRWSILF